MITKNRRIAPEALLLLMLLALAFCTSPAAHEVDHEPEPDHRHLLHGDSSAIRSLIDAFRETGDDHYLDTAWQQLERDMAEQRPGADTLINAATVAQARHDFELAQQFIEQALTINPGYDQAWLLSASIHLLRGETDAARKACRRLRSATLVAMLTCSARVQIAEGQHSRALLRLTAVLDAVDYSTENATTLAWALSVAGDAATEVDRQQAIGFYRQSLLINETTQVRAALVDQLILSGQFEIAEAALAAGHDALPLVVRQFVVARGLGKFDDVAAAVDHVDHEFRHWISDADFAHAREMTRFYLDVVDRPDLARELAKINLELQQEPEDLRLADRAGV